MKRRRFLSILLALCTVFSLFAVAVSVTAADGEGVPQSAAIISDPVDVLTPIGTSIGSGVPSGHGQNQTRIINVPSGTYIGVLSGEQTDEDDVGVTFEFSIVRITTEGAIEHIYTGKTHNISSTISMMADKDGNVWFYTGWATQSGLFVFNVWEYEVATGNISHYDSRQKVKGGGGKAVSLIDPVAGKIYAVQGGSLHFSWCAFDIATREWGKAQSVRTDAMYAYTFGYGDGKGGFYVVNERADSNGLMSSNIEGLNVAKAMERFRSRKIDADFMWDQGNFIYVPDATANEWDPRVITPVVYDVENGVYPNWTNAQNDVIYDEANGLMYVACAYADNGVPGMVNHVFTIDINDNFKVIEDKTFPYLQGENADYFHRFYLDTLGNLWLVLTNSHDPYVEIWKGEGETKTDFRLVYNEKLPGFFSRGNALLAATNRGGSIPSDIAHVITDFNSTWYYMKIDFAALRERMT